LISIISARYHDDISFIEGSLEVKLPTIWTDEKAKVGRVREEKSRRKKIRKEKKSEDRRCRCAKK
jgi:predicted nucleic acid-binding protein